MGGIIDGFPPGFKIDHDALLAFMAKRRPGSSSLVSARNEADTPEFLSGISPDGVTLGTPIGFIVRNSDHHSSDYDEMARLYRPNHADFSYMARYGIRDHRGGGRASARETVNWVVAGALATQWLASKGIRIEAALSQVGKVSADNIFDEAMANPSKSNSLKIDPSLKEKMEAEILQHKKAGNSVGGRVSCMISGIPAGIGNPVAGKLHSALAAAMMSINAAKGFEYGLGFRAAAADGLSTADTFIPQSETDKHIRTVTNFSGGIQGGISNGMPILFSVAFKPTPTLLMPQATVDILGNPATLHPAGRHDPCVAVRAVPVVEAMAALVIADYLL